MTRAVLTLGILLMLAGCSAGNPAPEAAEQMVSVNAEPGTEDAVRAEGSFGGNEACGVLMAATSGVPLYACGGGTIPLLQAWLQDGMSMGSAAAFMITGPSTKITNLGALKIVLGMKHFLCYLLFVMIFSLMTGLAVNLL